MKKITLFGLLNESVRFIFKNISSYLLSAFMLALPVIVVWMSVAAYFSFAREIVVPPEPTNEVNITDTQTETEKLSTENTEETYEIKDEKDEKDEINTESNEENSNNQVVDFTPIESNVLLGLLALSFIYIFITSFSFIRIITLISNNKPWTFEEVFDWTLKNIIKMVELVARIMLYNYTWFIMAGFIAFSVIFQLNEMATITYRHEKLAMVIGIILGSLAFIGLIMNLIRTPRATFTFYAFTEGNMTPKEALNDSIGKSKGHWFKIVFYIVAIIFLHAIYNSISNFFPSNIQSVIQVMGMALFGILHTTFFMLFYRRLKK